MPPSAVHLNGSVNLADEETVMREVLARIPTGLRRVTDGEPGDRRGWIQFQLGQFQQIARLGVEAQDGTYGRPKIALPNDVDAAALSWPDLGYARVYRQSYDIFERLDQEGLVPADLRFQVEYPTPLAPVIAFIATDDRDAILPSYERALFADLRALLAEVPHDRIAVQWDVAVEFGVLERSPHMELTDVMDFGWVIELLERCVDQVPDDVPVGAHLCYGDLGHRHFVEPTSLETQVRVINALNASAHRALDWFSMTVPQQTTDDAFFAPLADLQIPESVELYLSLVPYHPEEQPANTTERQVHAIDRVLGSRPWGISTECGMGRVDRDDVLPMLDAHDQMLALYA
jgi:hypothetical protein